MDDTEKKVAELNAILARDDRDFIVYSKSSDGSVATLMRHRSCPRWAWALFKRVAPSLLLRRRASIADAETALLRDEY